MIALRQLLARIFEPAVPEDQAAAKLGRDLTKWVFELARNLIVLGALKYFSDSTGNVFVSVAYSVCLVALLLYILTYWQMVYLRVFDLVARNTYTAVLDLALNVTIALALFAASSQVVSAIVSDIARVQAR